MEGAFYVVAGCLIQSGVGFECGLEAQYVIIVYAFTRGCTMEELNDSMMQAKEILARHFRPLRDQVARVRTLCDRDSFDGYGCYAPTVFDKDDLRRSVAARNVLIDAACQLFYIPGKEPELIPGVLCSSPETIEAIHKLNELKTAFKRCVAIIRKQFPVNSAINQLIRKGYTVNDDGQNTMELLHDTLNLKRCYAHLKVLPPNTLSVSYTWANRHTSGKKVSRDKVEKEMIPNLQGEDAQATALKLLNSVSDDEFVLIKGYKPPVLRANTTYREDGDTQRSSLVVSGALIVGTRNPPHLRWRETEDSNINNPSPVRRKNTIEEEPYIKTLKLHRYAPRYT